MQLPLHGVDLQVRFGAERMDGLQLAEVAADQGTQKAPHTQ